VLDTIRTTLETEDGGGIYMIVLDQVTALFKDQLINTNSAGTLHYFPGSSADAM